MMNFILHKEEQSCSKDNEFYHDEMKQNQSNEDQIWAFQSGENIDIET